MKVIVPVGTSLFENYCQSRSDTASNYIERLKQEQNRTLNKSFLQFWEDRKIRMDNIIRPKLQEWVKGKPRASAEIYSLQKIFKRHHQHLSVYLLASETILSRLAAEILYKELQQYQILSSINFDAEKDVIAGLQVADPNYFKDQGMLNLMNRVNEIVGNTPEKAAINMTGGFKAVVPFLAIYGQLYGIPTYYIFEKAEAMIRLPELPINFDFSVVEDYYTAFEEANKETQNLKTKNEFLINLENDPGQAEKLLQDFIQRQLFKMVEDERISLTVYGKLLFEYFRKNYFKRVESGNFIGEFMELKLYEFFMTTQPKHLQIFHSKKFGAHEADLLVIDHQNKKVEVIESKAGGNVKFQDIKNNKILGLLPKVKNEYSDYRIHFQVYCYHHRNKWEHLLPEMRECSDLAKKHGADETGWFWVVTDKHSTNKISKQQINSINLMEV